MNKASKKTAKSISSHKSAMNALSRTTAKKKDVQRSHSKDHPGHYWVKSSSKHTLAKCDGCGASSRVNTAEQLNKNKSGWK